MTSDPQRPGPSERRMMLVDVETGAYRAIAPRRGPMPAKPGLDPWQAAHDWPERWRDYLHAHFRGHMAVAQAFQVSEKAARKWWDGAGSCRGDKAAMAIALHPDTAPQMLFGIAAE